MSTNDREQLAQEAIEEFESVNWGTEEPTFNDFRKYLKRQAEFFKKRQRDIGIISRHILMIDAQLDYLHRYADKYAWPEEEELETLLSFSWRLVNTLDNTPPDDLDQKFFHDVIKFGKLFKLLVG